MNGTEGGCIEECPFAATSRPVVPDETDPPTAGNETADPGDSSSLVPTPAVATSTLAPSAVIASSTVLPTIAAPSAASDTNATLPPPTVGG